MQTRLITALFLSSAAWAGTTGSIAGTIKDQSGAVIPGAKLTVTHTTQGIQTKTTSDSKGDYTFPSLPVGRYDLQVIADGFKPQNRTGLTIDLDSALQIDLALELAQHVEEVTVAENDVRVETTSSQMGEVVTGKSMTAVALNGRSFTDLLALQPGIVPTTTQQPDSIVMAGASVAIAPSGTLNPGNQSISGQREDANGFMVNGGDVKELMNGGTSIVPNLDSIAEFRILTNNFDAEYGNYSGGVVNVVTKSGSNELHGSGFEFLRNTALDARNFFSPERSFYRQNQFGGTVGGPIRKNKVFFFGDYQGTRQSQGIDTGLIPVPTLADRTGNLSDQRELAGRRSERPISWRICFRRSSGTAFRRTNRTTRPGCTSAAQCVFPNAMIPQRAWSEPAQTSAAVHPRPERRAPERFPPARKARSCATTKAVFAWTPTAQRWGLLSGYYYFDDYNLNNPYPTGQGGASVPGFAALNLGRSQLFNLGDTKTFGATTVNELRLSYMRNANNVGQPVGGVGPSLASQGFVTGPGTPGIVVLAPKIEGIENVSFNSFVMGTPITNLAQANNTFAIIDNFSKVRGPHTIKAGIQLSYRTGERQSESAHSTDRSSFTVPRPARISRIF